MIYLIIPALIVAADQLVKWWAKGSLAGMGRVDFIPGFINLLYTENTGAAFSILQNQRVLLSALSFIFSCVLIFFIVTKKIKTKGELVTMAMVLGGALGNMIDRMFHGYVADMFEFAFMRFAIFNVADIFVTVGGALFVIFFLLADVKAAKAKRAAEEER